VGAAQAEIWLDVLELSELVWVASEVMRVPVPVVDELTLLHHERERTRRSVI
jgi:hypothetical protein